jgi:uncharacterized membrane protein
MFMSFAARVAKIRFLMITAMLAGFALAPALPAAKDEPVVHAILFYSPTCPHCALVKEEVLPPLMERYGSRLQIALINTATQTGHELFLSACMKHGLLRLSVPLLIVGNAAMVGSEEIPARFPDLIAKNMAAGGIGWPNIPGLSALLAANPAAAPETEPGKEPPAAESAVMVASPGGADAKPQETPSPTQTASAIKSKPQAPIMNNRPPVETAAKSAPAVPQTPALPARAVGSLNAAPARQQPVAASNPGASSEKSADTDIASAQPAARTTPSGLIDLTGGMEEMGILDRIKRDLYGNGLAILVLAGMIVTVLISPRIMKKADVTENPEIRPRYDWLIPILILAGLGVAAYLSNVEVRQVEAVCGPVGDCNTVNQSKYAKLFGILPIGVLGLAGFLAILAAWTLRRWGSGKLSLWAAVGILAMTAFGTLFSIYLTFLEPFVIGATCLWCLSSAVIMTTLFILALKPGRQAWAALR